MKYVIRFLQIVANESVCVLGFSHGHKTSSSYKTAFTCFTMTTQVFREEAPDQLHVASSKYKYHSQLSVIRQSYPKNTYGLCTWLTQANLRINQIFNWNLAIETFRLDLLESEMCQYSTRVLMTVLQSNMPVAIANRNLITNIHTLPSSFCSTAQPCFGLKTCSNSSSIIPRRSSRFRLVSCIYLKCALVGWFWKITHKSIMWITNVGLWNVQHVT